MIDKDTRIKIAIQKSGRLTDHSLDLLQRCGLKYTRARDQLICFGENMPLDILLVRDDDIPALVRDDVCDLGVVGLNIVEEKRQALIGKLGENITIRRAALHRAEGKLGHYLHGIRIGVIVDVDGGDDTLGKDLAMHIAASKPIAVSREQVPQEAIEREREIAKARALESGKPENIVEKIVDGSVQKFLSEITLHGQPFVKDDKKKVKDLITELSTKTGEKITMGRFARFAVGG